MVPKCANTKDDMLAQDNDPKHTTKLSLHEASCNFLRMITVQPTGLKRHLISKYHMHEINTSINVLLASSTYSIMTFW